MIESNEAFRWASIALGGALGAILRGALLLAALSVPQRRGRSLATAHAVLAANLVACALLGAISVVGNPNASAIPSWATEARLTLLTTGICGSLSTFSTVCGDVAHLARAGRHASWIAYLAAHLLGGPLALGWGIWVAS